VLVYLLINDDRIREAQALFARDSDWRSDAFVLIEFSNVLGTYLRAGALGRAQPHKLLGETEGADASCSTHPVCMRSSSHRSSARPRMTPVLSLLLGAGE
jgi:hypothetical protein